MAQADIRAVITAEDNGSAALKSFGHTIDGVNGSVKESSSKFSGLWAQITKGTLVTAGVYKGVQLITASVDDAIKRVDTLNNANRTFQNMGFHTDNVKKSMDALNKSILGLPTPLDQAVQGVTMLAAANNDLGMAQKVYSALNDAILGFGGTAVDVQGAVLQLSQDMAGGVLHAQTWNSMLQNGLGPTLAAIARQMGITTQQLRDGLSKGDISVKTFEDKLVSMDKNGGGGLKSLQKIAHDSTNGINTSMANAQTAITRALANIIQSIGQANIANTIRAVGNATATAITYIGKFIQSLKEAWNWIEKNREKITAIIDVIVFWVKVIVGYLQPAFDALLKTLKTEYLPTFEKLYKALQPALIDVLKFLAFVIGITLIAAIKIALIALNDLIRITASFYGVLAKVITWIGDTGGAIINFSKNIPKYLSGVTDAIEAPFKAAFKYIKQGIQDIEDAFNRVKNDVTAAPGHVTSGISGLFHKLPSFATGGTVPGPTGQATLAVVHGGEQVIPVGQGKSNSHNVTVNIAVNAQAFMGSHVQARDFARVIFKELQNIAITKNTTVANLVLR